MLDVKGAWTATTFFLQKLNFCCIYKSKLKIDLSNARFAAICLQRRSNKRIHTGERHSDYFKWFFVKFKKMCDKNLKKQFAVDYRKNPYLMKKETYESSTHRDWRWLCSAHYKDSRAYYLFSSMNITPRHHSRSSKITITQGIAIHSRYCIINHDYSSRILSSNKNLKILIND